jgi:lactate permease
MIIIAIFSLAQLGPIKDALDSPTQEFGWPGLNITDPDGEAISSATFKFNWLAAAGTLLLFAGLLSMLVLKLSPGRALATYAKTLDQLKWAILTVAAVLGLAYVMNQSGQTTTLGLWIAGAGGIFAFLSGMIGWLGVAVTGSDTSSNSLFGALQVAAAKESGLSPTLLAAANTSGGVMGKMISPQNLAIGAARSVWRASEGELLPDGWWAASLLLLCSCAAWSTAVDGHPQAGWWSAIGAFTRPYATPGPLRRGAGDERRSRGGRRAHPELRAICGDEHVITGRDQLRTVRVRRAAP